MTDFERSQLTFSRKCKLYPTWGSAQALMAEFDSEFLEPRGREYVQKQFSTIRALHTIALYDEAALKQWIAQVERVLHDFESMGFSHDWG